VLAAEVQVAEIDVKPLLIPALTDLSHEIANHTETAGYIVGRQLLPEALNRVMSLSNRSGPAEEPDHQAFGDPGRWCGGIESRCV
jgi:hypothetical protein